VAKDSLSDGEGQGEGQGEAGLGLTLLLKWLLTLIPFCQADAVADKADQKRNCLSRRRVFALPVLTVIAAGTRVAGAGSGVAFFLLTLFLAKQEKVSGCRAAPG
jgi:hypothetical protein